jgi:hypothetical protein
MGCRFDFVPNAAAVKRSRRQEPDAIAPAVFAAGLLFGALGPTLGYIRRSIMVITATRSKNCNHSWIDCFSNIGLLRNRLLPGHMRGNDLKELFVL